ncbi:hypothetical protein J4465_02755 [Candidatus Pacearchaeota archaeon]|nr:hypothetical protein [Candidatus Pacearchaeota archaeon]
MKRQDNQNISKKIDGLFSEISKDQNQTKIKKAIQEIIEIAKRNSLPLRERRKLFCRKCLSYFFIGKNCQIKINKNIKAVKCLNCGNISRFKLK